MATKFFTAGDAPDPAYCVNRDSEFRQDIRDRIERAWSEYEPYCPDEHFLVDARSHFFQRTWECYLASTLLRSSVKLLKPKPTGPDVLVDACPRCWIEATAPAGGDGADRVAVRENRMKREALPSGGTYWIGHSPSVESVILRITSAVADKNAKRSGWIASGLLNEDDPFVVAISLCAIEDADVTASKPGPPLLAKAFLGVGEPYLAIPVDSSGPPERGHLSRDAVTKRSGAPVSRRGFLDDELSGVSGVILNPSGILNVPMVLGSEFVFLHNPCARNRLPPSYFPFGTEYILRDDALHETKHFAVSKSGQQTTKAT